MGKVVKPKAEDIPSGPFLAYTMKKKWIVVVPERPAYQKEHGIIGYSRPGSMRISLRDIEAIAPLPPVPEHLI